jgi:hypothetical protein
MYGTVAPDAHARTDHRPWANPGAAADLCLFADDDTSLDGGFRCDSSRRMYRRRGMNPPQMGAWRTKKSAGSGKRQPGLRNDHQRLGIRLLGGKFSGDHGGSL